jgi:hypothetical protein
MIRVLHGDCREVLPSLDAASVQCVVTSPPYFGLRDYLVAGQIGLEISPDAYVAELVAVFREVRRVMRDDATLWLNLGDSYSRNSAKGQHKPGAGTSERGCCAACGKPWVRQTERVGGIHGKSWHNHENDLERGQRGGASGYHGDERKAYENSSTITTGWQQGCSCPPSEPIPCVVLDCFAGAFTSALVADRLQRDAIGIELNETYVKMARARIEKDAGLFAQLADR